MSCKLYSKSLAFLTSGSIVFSLCSCSSKNNSVEVKSSSVVTSSVIEPPVLIPAVTSSVTTEPIVTTNLVTSSITTEPIVTTNLVTSSVTTEPIVTTNLVTSSITTEPIVTTSVNVIEDEFVYSDNDLIVLDEFSNLGKGVIEEVNENGFLEKGKTYFIYCVDFLFYDGEIKGIRFSDLTDSAKQQLLIDITNIDDIICSKYPNYKETIGDGVSSAYSKAGEIIREGSKNLKDFSRDKLGEENYDKIGKYKDMFIDTAFGDWDVFTGFLGKGKQKVKNWYENFRDDNEEGQ